MNDYNSIAKVRILLVTEYFATVLTGFAIRGGVRTEVWVNTVSYLIMWLFQCQRSKGPVIDSKEGGYKMGKSEVQWIERNTPTPHINYQGKSRVNAFVTPPPPPALLKCGHILRPHFSMADTSSPCI